jgi:hypothetical protein
MLSRRYLSISVNAMDRRMVGDMKKYAGEGSVTARWQYGGRGRFTALLSVAEVYMTSHPMRT